MSETSPVGEEKHRRASQTAVDAGLANADDAAMLGMIAQDLEDDSRYELNAIQQNWATSKSCEGTSP